MSIKFHCSNCNVTHTQKDTFPIDFDMDKIRYNEDLEKNYIKYKKLWADYHTNINKTKTEYEATIEKHNKTAHKKKQWKYQQNPTMQFITEIKTNKTIQFKFLNSPPEELKYFDNQYKEYEKYFECPTCKHKYYVG